MSFGFTLYGQPATKKNSAMMVAKHACLLPSKAYKRYEAECRKQMSTMKLEHFTGNVNLCCLYWLRDKAHWPDLNGLLQAICDIISDEYTRKSGTKVLAREWVLADDRLVRSFNGSMIAGIDREKPRVEIVITESKEKPIDPYVLKQKEQ